MAFGVIFGSIHVRTWFPHLVTPSLVTLYVRFAAFQFISKGVCLEKKL